MSETLSSTPVADGFAMPAEWARHDGCWMLWPQRPDNWRDEGGPAQAAFVAVAHAIHAGGDPVAVGATADRFAQARAALDDCISVVEIPSNDAWMRDVGPTFVTDATGNRRGVDWIFNAWGGVDGGLYADWQADDEVAARVLTHTATDRYRAPIVLEGGALHVDGEGTVLTTEQCLLNPNRNPALDRDGVESALHAYLGTEKVLWLGDGVIDDETDGHIDNFCCFVAPGVVLLHWTDDTSDPQHAVSVAARERLEAMTDARGRALTVHTIPMPGPLVVTDEEAAGVEENHGTQPRRPGDRLAGSYVNFYIANEAIVMPLLDPRTDDEAAETLQRLFPTRRVVGVAAREILLGGGNVHCITQQVPSLHT